MQTSIFLARLLGPLLLIVGIGIFVNKQAFRTMATEVVRSVTLVYLFGLIDLASGIAILLVHNVWTANWRVLITLIGWLMVLRGTARVLVPEKLMPYAARMFRRDATYTISGAVLLILGAILCYFGYRA